MERKKMSNIKRKRGEQDNIQSKKQCAQGKGITESGMYEFY